MTLPFLFLAVPLAVGSTMLFRRRHRRQNQIEFIRQKLAAAPKQNFERRVIAALSTLPDRIGNLEPTIRCLLDQTRPPDEIVIQIPEFSRRQRKRYVIPDYLQDKDFVPRRSINSMLGSGP